MSDEKNKETAPNENKKVKVWGGILFFVICGAFLFDIILGLASARIDTLRAQAIEDRFQDDLTPEIGIMPVSSMAISFEGVYNVTLSNANGTMVFRNVSITPTNKKEVTNE